MKRVVLEGPYAGDVERNRKYLDACILDCIRRGESPYASHKMLTDSLDDEVPEERELGIRAGLAWGELADYVVMYVDFGVSPGMAKAHAFYQAQGLQVEQRRLEDPALAQLAGLPGDPYYELRRALKEAPHDEP